MGKRGDGKLPSLLIEADTLAGGWHKAMIECYNKGVRATDPGYQNKPFLSYDADINIHVSAPLEEPLKHRFAVYDDDRGIMQYILEVTHGIHNHWKRNLNDPTDTRWGYTYNERFAPQIPFLLARIKQDWEKKKDLSSRKYSFAIWRPKEDVILEQPDPPCWQRGHLRFLQDDKEEWHLNYITEWRSRDLAKAWNENNIAQVRLMKLIADKTSDMLEIPINIGAYIDKSSSLHIYGRYFEEGIEKMLAQLIKMPVASIGMPLFMNDETQLKRLIAAQTDAENKGLGKNLSESGLRELKYDLDNFPYPKDWDSWPKEWDMPLDKSTLK